MNDYSDLIKHLRDASKMSAALAVLLPHSEGNATAKLFNEAADAIEELSATREEQKAQIILMAAEIEEQKPRWISVEERLPEYGKPVLLYFNRNNHNSMGVGDCYHDGDTLIWRACGFIPTHWMPLPKPPKEGT